MLSDGRGPIPSCSRAAPDSKEEGRGQVRGPEVMQIGSGCGAVGLTLALN